MRTVGEILVDNGIITQAQLEEALGKQEGGLGQTLVKLGMVSEAQFLQALADQRGVSFVNLKETSIEEVVIKAVPAKFVWHYKVMPLKIKGKTLMVAIPNQAAMLALEDLETNLGYFVEEAFATESDILDAIKKYYGVAADTVERILDKEVRETETQPSMAEEKVEDLEKMTEDASVIKLVNQILHQAITDRATDIHIERFRNEVTLRYRIDGVLYDAQVAENIKFLYAAVVSRIKVMSGLDIIERRIPQDGRAKVRIGKHDYDLRVSTMPTLHEESIVIRILPLTMLFSMSDLGMSKPDLEIVEKLLQKPHGLIFVTGPTGCGKSTTLYSCLSKLNTRGRKIVTIEDPVEYELKGVLQTQINPKIELTFARLLRSMLRHDPNIMMVGEVRDFETAEIAIQSALTGHLVFSTLHTNDAASGVTRLLDIGLEPYLVASSVQAFIAQRLVRVLCKQCKVPVTIDIAPLGLRRITPDRTVKAFRGGGCKACSQTGYAGRTGIYETLPVTDEIRNLIVRKSSSEIIKASALQMGMHSLRQDGLEKVLAGETTLEEIMRVTQAEA